MGHITSREHLVLRWAELCADPQWDGVPGKIELNGRGVIEMSPASNRHGIRQMAIGHAGTQQVFDSHGLRGASRFGVVLG